MDFIQRGWLDGRWRQAVAIDGAERFVVTRVRDDQDLLVCVHITSRGGVQAWAVHLAYDPAGRLVEFRDDSRRGAYRIRYEYAPSGAIAQETLIRPGLWDHRAQVVAVHHRDRDGELVRIEVRDGLGRLIEERNFLGQGRFAEIRGYNGRGDLCSQEQSEFLPDGRLLERCRVQYGAPDDPDQPVSDLVEILEYSPVTRNPIRRRLVLRQTDGTTGAAPDWHLVSTESITYDPDQDGRPLRDESCYYRRREDGASALQQRILLSYEYDGEGQLEATNVLEEDVTTGAVRSRWVRHAFEVIENGWAEGIG